MKLKLKTQPLAGGDSAPASSPAPSEAQTPGGSAPKIKFKFSAPAPAPAPAPADGQPADTPKQKRKYTKKPKFDENGNAIEPTPKTVKLKRPRDGNSEDGAPIAKRKPKPTIKSLERIDSDDEMLLEDAPAPAVSASVRAIAAMRKGSTIRLKVKPTGASATTATPTVLKLKGVQGKPPPRPPGQGYDSEAEEAEIDPAIESQFVLRMQPGPDCDLLRKAIEEKKIGKPGSEGGTNVIFRFLDREGRRTTIKIQDRLYAATMVDLPCIVESMKSWNKKDWVKTADICQMLLVLGRVQNEQEAKSYPLPREIDPHKHQYPHGLTPPMHYVRKRRFRPRQSYHEIEQREAMVNSLLAADETARESGGNTEYQIIDENMAETDESGEDDGRDDEDVTETTEQQYVIEAETPGGDTFEIDDNGIEQDLIAGFMEEDDEDGGGHIEGEVQVETPPTAHDVATHALGENAASAPDTAASTPNAATSPDDDDDDDDDAESAADDQATAEAAAAQEGLEQGMAEIRELEQEIARAQEQFNSSNNVLYKQRCKKKIAQLQTDLDLKKAALGLGDDGD